MKPNLLPLEISINEFINLIKALEMGGYLHHHHLTSISGKHDNALPFNLSIAIKHLEHAQEVGVYSEGELTREFKHFIEQLVVSARSNTFNPSIENNHAACLLGFMLHHNVHIKVGNQKGSFADLVYSYLPKEEVVYSQTAPLYGHPFLKPTWQAAQQYPSIPYLSQIFNEDLQRQALAKQIVEQKRAATLAQQAQNRFDGLTLSLNEFSLVLEAFIKLGYVTINHAQSIQSKQPQLAGSVLQLMQQFANFSKQSPQQGLPAFLHMMKEIIAGAKYRQDPASQQLLGFMLHHNFRLQVANQTITMAEIFWSEATQQERHHIQAEGGQKLPFIQTSWQQQRGYPGRVQLEQAIAPSPAVATPSVNTTAAQKNYLPGFSQQSAQKPPFVLHNMQFQAASQPRARCF